MKVIIMGCGQVGEQLTRLMSKEGHDVSIIDPEVNFLDRLGPDVRCQKIHGVGFDHDVLIRAGIERADAFAATSRSDNINIVAARTARNIFHVPRVVARLYDPRRAEIYRRLGLITISMTTWGAERIRELLTFVDLEPDHVFGSGEVLLTRYEVPLSWVGHIVRDLNVPGELSIAAIIRQGKAFIPILGSEFKDGDVLQVIVAASALDRFKMLLGFGEGG